MMGCSTETTVAWFLCHTHKPTPHHLRLSTKGILNLFQASLVVLALVDMIFLLFPTQLAGHEFGSNLMHVQTVFQNALN
jgi:hypothetical protein